MTEYTSLEVSERLLQARKIALDNRGHDDMGNCEASHRWYVMPRKQKPRLLPYSAELGSITAEAEIAPAYNSGTLLAWLVESGYGVEIVRDAPGDIHACAGQYPATAPTLPDALAEVAMKVLAGGQDAI